MKLDVKHVIELTPTSPFNFDATFFKPGHFPSKDTKWEKGRRWQTVLWGGQKLGLVYEDRGTKMRPKVGVRVFSRSVLAPDFLTGLKEEIIWRFNLGLDLAEFYKDVTGDLLLAPAVKNLAGLRPMHYGSLYEYLVVGIMLQNTVVRRSISMLQALFEKYGDLLEYDREKLWCYWEPKVLAEADEQELRALKVGYRAKSLIRVSQPFAKGEINEQELRVAGVEEQEKTLLSLYGVGPATVGYIMVDALHKWDYLKNISPWEQKILSRLVFGKRVSVERLLRRFSRWGKWQALALHYLWEDLWWRHKKEPITWLAKEIRD